MRRKLNPTSKKGGKYTAKAAITVEDIANNYELENDPDVWPMLTTLYRFVHSLLLMSERAWAQAMQMKSTHAADSGSKGITGSTRRHIGSRIHKASTYAEQLVEILKEKDAAGVVTNGILEARAYHLSLLGAAEFEKQSWLKCLQYYSEARLIYSGVAHSENTKKADLLRDLLSTTIDPSIRYAAYQSKIPRTTSIDSIVVRYVTRNNEFVEEVLKSNPAALDDPTIAPKEGPRDSAENVLKNITWRSRMVNLEDAATAQALATVAAAEQKLSTFLSSNVDLDPRARAAAYDEVLIPSQDAVDATKTAIDELSAEGVPQGDRHMQALQITKTAVNYALIGWRIGRNRMLCGKDDGATLEDLTPRKPKKPRKDGKDWVVKEESTGRKLARLRERVVLYDATLQSIDSVKELPGVAADPAFIVELEAKRSYFAALRYSVPIIGGTLAYHQRCLAIARSHSFLGSTKNALALFSRALEHSSLANPSSLNQPTSPKPPSLDLSPAQASSLQNLLRSLVTHYHALVELHNLASSSASKSGAKPSPLIENLDEYPTNGADLTNLVTYPPKVEPIPVKPLFLDVAWNYIEYPGRERNVTGNGVNGLGDGAAKPVEEKKEAKKGGWFGFGR